MTDARTYPRGLNSTNREKTPTSKNVRNRFKGDHNLESFTSELWNDAQDVLHNIQDHPFLREVQEGVSAFVDGLRFNIGLGVGDQVALMTFGGARFILVDWTSDLEQLKEGATKLRARPATGAFLPDAVNDTAKDFAEREAARPVLVVVATDGIDYGSHHDYRRIVQDLRASYTLMYSVFIPTASRRLTLNWDSRERDALLSEGPRQTGGRRINLSGSQPVRDALISIQNELASQYVVTYHRPESPVPPQRLSLGVTRPNLTVRLTPRKPQ